MPLASTVVILGLHEEAENLELSCFWFFGTRTKNLDPRPLTKRVKRKPEIRPRAKGDKNLEVAGLTEMHLLIDTVGQHREIGRVKPRLSLSGLQVTDSGDASGAHTDVRFHRPARNEHRAAVNNEIETLAHKNWPSYF